MTTLKDARLPEEVALPIEKKLLGRLQLDIMSCMWQVGEATVRQVVEAINRERPISYTAVMTVMARLAEKRLLSRTMVKNGYHYQVSKSKHEFVQETCKNKIRALLDDFGDRAIEGFYAEMRRTAAAPAFQMPPVTVWQAES